MQAMALPLMRGRKIREEGNDGYYYKKLKARKENMACPRPLAIEGYNRKQK